MNVQYKGDVWLSPYRGESNEILLIVDDTVFKEINGKEKQDNFYLLINLLGILIYPLRGKHQN